jgi:hypothetical protein
MISDAGVSIRATGFRFATAYSYLFAPNPVKLAIN